MNPAESPLVNSYTQALYSAALERGVLDEIAGQARDVHSLMQAQPRFRAFLGAPNISRAEKERVLTVMLKDSFHPLFLSLMRLLIRRGRLLIVRRVLRNMEFFHDRHHDIYQAIIITAVELGADERKRMQDRLERHLNLNLKISWRTDPSVVGGVRFLCGDILIDRTISDQLFRLRSDMLRAKVY